MLYADSPHGGKITATPTTEGKCPLCGAALIPKCGSINAWHWAHKTTADCDPWSDGETAWHLGWKKLVEPAFCEFRLPPHRADILGNDATVIELQHSPISAEEIQERERFYDNMVWLFDGTALGRRFKQERRCKYNVPWYSQDLQWVDFRWKHTRRSLGSCQKPIYLDIGNGTVIEFHYFHPQSEYSETYSTWYEAGEGSGAMMSHAEIGRASCRERV